MKELHTNKVVLWLILVIAFTINSPVQAISLQEAIQQAFSHIPALEAAQAEIGALKQDISIARSVFRPQLNLSLNLEHGEYSNSATRSTQLGGGGGGFQGVDSYNANILLRQRLFDYKLTSGQVSAARERYLIGGTRLTGLQEQISRDTALAYINVLRFRQGFEIAKLNVKDGERLANIIRRQVAQGRVAEVDGYLATSLVAAARNQLRLQEGLLEEAEVRYRELVGELPPEQMEKIPSVASFAAFSLGEQIAIRKLLGYHPVIQIASKETAANRSLIKSRRSVWVPRLDLEAFFGDGENESGINGENDNYGLRLLMQWDLFAGGRQFAELKQSKKALEVSEWVLDDSYRTAIEAVNAAQIRLSSIRARLEFLHEREEANMKVYEVYQSQLTAGRQTPLDVFFVLNNLNQARLASNDGKFEELARQYEVVAAFGQLGKFLGAY